MRYTCFDMFAGAGGFSLGMEAAGFKSIGAIELDAVASQTLIHNFGNHIADFLGPSFGDIRNITEGQVVDHLSKAGYSQLDVLIASPPCQGFSKVGRGKLDCLARQPGSFVVDERNHLYTHAIRLLRALRPRVFLFENVTGILHLRFRNVAEEVCDAISQEGYVVRSTVLNSAWYGVPQTRERVIIMGVREDLNCKPEFPQKKHEVQLSRGAFSGAGPDPYGWRNFEYFVDPKEICITSPVLPAVSVEEAFDDLPPFTAHLEAMKNGTKYRTLRTLFSGTSYHKEPQNAFCYKMRHWNEDIVSHCVEDHFCRWTPRDFITFARMKPGDRYPEAHAIAVKRYEEAMIAHEKGETPWPLRMDFVPPYPLDSFKEKWRKLIPTQPSWTVTAHLSKDTYSHIHFDSSQARSITIREASRIQSFPDAFRFAGNTGDAFRQIGNAVPPLMAKAIGEVVVEILAQAEEPCRQNVANML